MSQSPHTARRRMRTTVVAALSIGALLTGCSGAASDADADAETVLTFFSWENEATMEPVIQAFEAENPGITVEISHAPPPAEYVATLQSRLLANTAADVFVMGSENKTNLIDGGFIVDLTDEPYMDVVAPLNATVRGSEGRVYALSVASWAAGIAYNEDILANLGYDEFPTEWDDFVELLRAIKETGVAPFIETWSQIPTTVASTIGASIAGGAPTDADIFAGDASFEEVWEEPLQGWVDLFDEGLITRDVVGISSEQTLDEFATGRTAMTTTGPWNVTAIDELNPDLNWAFAGIPQPAGDPFFSGNASPGWAINTKAKEPEAAHKFLAFLASPEGLEIYQEQTQSMTTTSNFEPEIAPVLEPNLLALQEDRVYLPQAAWPRYQDALNVEAVAQLQLMASGQLSAAQVGAAMDAKLAQLGG